MGDKIKIISEVFQPTELYGCESWVMNKTDEELNIWERKVQRKVFGGFIL